MLLSQCGFESDCPKTKFQTLSSKVSSETAVRRCSSNFRNRKTPGVQGLQAFAFCVVTVNDEHSQPRFKRKCMGYV